jgi:hypothetical protein
MRGSLTVADRRTLSIWDGPSCPMVRARAAFRARDAALVEHAAPSGRPALRRRVKPRFGPKSRRNIHHDRRRLAARLGPSAYPSMGCTSARGNALALSCAAGVWTSPLRRRAGGEHVLDTSANPAALSQRSRQPGRELVLWSGEHADARVGQGLGPMWARVVNAWSTRAYSLERSRSSQQHSSPTHCP